MGLWIRVEADTRNSKKVRRFASDLGIKIEAAIGHLVCLWGQVAYHQEDGNIGDTPNDLIEEWAMWRGKPDRFADTYRAIFAPAGHIHHWEEHQGKLIDRRKKDRARQAEWRERHADSPRDVTRDTTRDIHKPKRGRSRGASALRPGVNEDEDRTTLSSSVLKEDLLPRGVGAYIAGDAALRARAPGAVRVDL